MQRIILVSAIILQLASYTIAGAAEVAPRSGSVSNPAITKVDGWWEQEHQEDRARQAYWRLPPRALERYNRLQIRINQLTAQRDQIDAQIKHAVHEQHELLGFGGR